VQVAGRLRRFFLRAADWMMPTQLAVAEHAHHLAAAHILSTIAELGVADQLCAGPQSAQELAAVLGCDPEALHRLLRAAAVFDFVRLDRQGRFHRTRATRVLHSGHPSATADWCRSVASPAQQAAWADLATSVRTGDPAFRRVHAMSMFEWFDQHPEEGALFSAGLGGLTRAEAPAIIAAYPFPKRGVVCDVAGGRGILLAEILKAGPELRGVLIESPQVLAQARDYFHEQNLIDRVELVEGDLFSSLHVAADVYLLRWILHDWDDVDCEKILRTIADTMPPGARLLTIEGEQDHTTVDPRFSIVDLVMLVLTEGGKERSRDELTNLISSSGLVPTSPRRSATGLLLIESTKR
jgi:ubiquinone/menaquinone biosynthesis C-methylase UbiE